MSDVTPYTDEQFEQMLCSPAAVVAKAAGDDLRRGDVVYVGSDGRVWISRSEFSPFEKFVALYDAPRGEPVALFGVNWSL